ncbi:MAG: preprotein translocase subunit SecE [Propionibacteriaceae bacterium]|nr:preprotein translocase subunit SecE [Propionibacteriaceae bacterium]
MAQKKAKGPQDPGSDPSPAPESTPETTPAADAQNLDDGYVSYVDGEAASVSEVPGAAGETPEAVAAEPEPAPSTPETFVEQIRSLAEAPGVPSGEELADEDLANPDDFEVIEEAAELTEDEPIADEPDDDGSILSLFKGTHARNVVNEEQADEARQEAAELASTKRPSRKTAEAPAAVALTAEAAETAPEKKNRPTRSRAEATKSDAPKKTGPVEFTGQVVQELKKVSWPSSSQLLRYFLIVLGFVLFMIAFIGLLDVLFGWLMLKLFS